MTSAIRRAVASDLASIERCTEAAYSIYVERIGRKPAPMVADFAAAVDAGTIHVEAGSGRVRGFVVFYPRDDHVHLENVAVDPCHQGHGIGRCLIAYVEAEAKRLGFDRVELYTNARMTENREYYPHLGYAEFDRRVEDGFDRVYYRKTLAQVGAG